MPRCPGGPDQLSVRIPDGEIADDGASGNHLLATYQIDADRIFIQTVGEAQRG